MSTTTKAKVHSITIQPAPQAPDLLKLPYPWHISEDGSVGRQEFWNGVPAKLVGFSIKPVAGQLDLFLEDFWMEPEACVDLYPVFENKAGEWATWETKIESYYFNYEE